MCYLPLEEKLAESFLNKGEKRLKVTLNNEHEIHVAIMRNKEVGYYLTMGKSVLNKTKLKEGDQITAQFEVDKSEKQFEFPDTIKEVLKTDPEAEAIFNQLTPGNQRSLIYLITRVKSTDKQIEKALKMAEYLKQGVSSARKMKL